MYRRDFLRSVSFLPSVAAIAVIDGWRTYEVTTRVMVLKPEGETRIWIPCALSGKVPFQKTLSNRVQANGGNARVLKSGDAADDLALVAATFPAGVNPVLTLASVVATKDYAVLRSISQKPSRAELQHFLRPTKLLPTDGIVKSTALEITKGKTTDLEKARAIYEWIVDNTTRNPKTLGCGRGDIRFMLESKDLSGKCADLNSLFVGLARAAGLPSRDVYGIRTAKSELGYKSLGASSDKVTKSQHCRAEVYIESMGWVPVDPADVRKVILEEPQMESAARKRLFGSWEMNWMAYNFAHDVTLPGSSGEPVPFLMYPQAETEAGRLNSLDPSSFQYEITAMEKMLHSS
jgi:transglutaminase-like putative cysteine protease